MLIFSVLRLVRFRLWLMIWKPRTKQMHSKTKPTQSKKVSVVWFSGALMSRTTQLQLDKYLLEPLVPIGKTSTPQTELTNILKNDINCHKQWNYLPICFRVINCTLEIKFFIREMIHYPEPTPKNQLGKKI